MAHQSYSAIYVRVATNPLTGFGHISRMLALRQVFKEAVKWFVDPGTKKDVNEWVPKTDEVYEETAVDSIAQLCPPLKSKQKHLSFATALMFVVKA